MNSNLISSEFFIQFYLIVIFSPVLSQWIILTFFFIVFIFIKKGLNFSDKSSFVFLKKDHFLFCVRILYNNPILRTSITWFPLWANVSVDHFSWIQVVLLRHFFSDLCLLFAVVQYSQTSNISFMLWWGCFAVARTMSSPGWPSFAWISFVWTFRVAIVLVVVFFFLDGHYLILDGCLHFWFPILRGQKSGVGCVLVELGGQ